MNSFVNLKDGQKSSRKRQELHQCLEAHQRQGPEVQNMEAGPEDRRKS